MLPRLLLAITLTLIFTTLATAGLLRRSRCPGPDCQPPAAAASLTALPLAGLAADTNPTRERGSPPAASSPTAKQPTATAQAETLLKRSPGERIHWLRIKLAAVRAIHDNPRATPDEIAKKVQAEVGGVISWAKWLPILMKLIQELLPLFVDTSIPPSPLAQRAVAWI